MKDGMSGGELSYARSQNGIKAVEIHLGMPRPLNQGLRGVLGVICLRREAKLHI